MSVSNGSGYISNRGCMAPDACMRNLPPSLSFIMNDYDIPVYSAPMSTPSYSFNQMFSNEPTYTFPYVLYLLLEDTKNSEWIRWRSDGTGFKFCSWPRLLEALNKKGMNMRLITSIKKNLNDYGFKTLCDGRRRIKTTNGKKWFEYSHKRFSEGDKNGLQTIRRKSGYR
ncbi:hypothetical protein COEREDRAFT_7885 [Coemansia reversa NRRL 1564]|uniref:HSF-type DNA-binding domain-containing protein n=1 Tax=Coemansia reversa (strain ATCC 12441 / NRRL 1564) TaxID=763665 RepID=A0A2G5BDM6_COERN|nr:hypothetical protein COEREDRAFT_7885 [Coemansia reversa NRRL 1564]|eukprot:PIA17120.1 hypothetical protein COEREDRAFT_7885 [Coemansia reversa NRRL 1564]